VLDSRPIARSRRSSRSRKPALSRNSLYLLGALLLLIGGIALLPSVRRERRHLLILRNLIEQAAAPDETVLVDSFWLDRFLRWKGSPALRQQLLLAHGGEIPGEILEPPKEVVVVGCEGDSLLTALRSYGYLLTPDATQDQRDAKGGISLPFRGALRIYFAAPRAAPPLPSNPQAVTP
jgi:hypothetical protein